MEGGSFTHFRALSRPSLKERGNYKSVRVIYPWLISFVVSPCCRFLTKMKGNVSSRIKDYILGISRSV
jgi:hypothetical protein